MAAASPTLGQAVLLDALQHDAATAVDNSAVRVDDETVLLAYEDQTGNGFIKLFHVGFEGLEITQIDSLRLGPATDFSLAQVDADTFAVAFRDAAGSGTIRALNLSPDGLSISEGDSLFHEFGSNADNSLVAVGGGVFALAYRGPLGGSVLKTFSIASDGSDIEELAREEHDSNGSEQHSLVRVGQELVALAYQNIFSVIKLFFIGQDGAILEIDDLQNAEVGLAQSLVALDEETLALVFTLLGGESEIRTFDILGDGLTRALAAADSLLYTTNGREPSAARVGDGALAVAYGRAGMSGGAFSLFTIDPGDSEIDFDGPQLEFPGTSVAGNSLVVLTPDLWVQAHGDPTGILRSFRNPDAPLLADLAVDLSASSATATPGRTITYSLEVTNSGPSANPAAEFLFFPDLQLLCTFTSQASGGASGNTASGVGSPLDVLDLPAGSAVSYEFVCDIFPFADLSLSSIAVIDPGAVTDPVPGNNSQIENSPLVPEPDLVVEVSDSEDPVTVVTGGGATEPQLLRYTTTVTNTGPSDARGVTVETVTEVPDGVFVVSTDAPAVIQRSGTTIRGTWFVGYLPVGRRDSLVLELEVTPETDMGVGVVTHLAEVTEVEGEDPDPSNSFDLEATSIANCPVIVTGTADSGPGSLRSALNCSNLSSEALTVAFEIPGDSPHTIELLSALPAITGPVDIDGTTQAGYVDTPVVFLDGQQAGADVDGLTFAGSDNRVAGLGVTGFGGGALVVTDLGTGNRFEANSLFGNGGPGIDLDGDGATPNDPGDADSGSNWLQNSAEIEAAAVGAGSIDVSYRVDSEPGNSTYPLTVEFAFADIDGEEGQTVIGTDIYTESDYSGCGQPPCAKQVTLLTGATGDVVVATATDEQGNTSEYGQGVTPDRAPTVVAVETVASSGAGDFAIGGSYRVPITQVHLTFSEAVTGADTAAAFRLVEAGDDGALSTASCAASPAGDDVAVA
ncbi:MAG: hypothetical protein AAGF23_10120, partial [Acidobacteriota bacterium]